MADHTAADIAKHPAAQAAAQAIKAASNPPVPVFDLIAEAKAEKQVYSPTDAYSIKPNATTLTDKELGKYNEIVENFSHTGQSAPGVHKANLKTFTDSLRSLNGEDEATRAHVSGALLTHGAKAGRNGASLMADTLVHVHGAKDLEFKAHISGESDAVKLPIQELVKHGTLSDSGNLPKWDKEQQDYLQTQIAHAQESAKKLYPQEHKTTGHSKH